MRHTPSCSPVYWQRRLRNRSRPRAVGQVGPIEIRGIGRDRDRFHPSIDGSVYVRIDAVRPDVQNPARVRVGQVHLVVELRHIRDALLGHELNRLLNVESANRTKQKDLRAGGVIPVHVGGGAAIEEDEPRCPRAHDRQLIPWLRAVLVDRSHRRLRGLVDPEDRARIDQQPIGRGLARGDRDGGA